MPTDELTEAVFALPEQERLELARRIVESVVTERRVSELVAEGERGLSEEEYRRAIE